MSELRPVLERLRDQLTPPPGGFEQVVAFRDRKRRRQRLGVVLLAMVVALAGVGLAIYAFRSQPPSRQPRPAASAANGLIAFGRGTGIYTMNPDGSGLTLLQDPGAVAYYDPQWSPDGTKIAFYGYPRGGGSGYGGGADYDIFVMNADGSGLTNLTTSPADVKTGFSQMIPVWSPDGTKIAYDGDDGLYVMNADGSDQTRIASGQNPSWSPDGMRIAFEGPGGAMWSVAPGGSGLTQLTSGAGFDGFPAFSPDGTKIAYYHGQDSDRAIYVMNADGSGRSVVADFQADTMGRLVWSPDGTKIAFDLLLSRYSEHGTWDIYVANTDGSGATDLTPTPNRDENTPVWSPDGTQIAFEASDIVARDIDNAGTFDIYVMNPDGTDQARLTQDVHSFGFDMSWQQVVTAEGTPTPSTTTSMSVTRCTQAKTAGDFDGDGTPDEAEIVDVVSGEVSCEKPAEVFDHLQSRELLVRFRSGGVLDQPFGDCQMGTCGDGIFDAVDLDGDGRDELAINVGPGASVDYMELYRVDPDGIRPLEVADPGDPPYVKPGPAIIGGGFDSGLQSSIACRVNADGTRELVSVHAENVGQSIAGPWKVHTTTMVLKGDRLVVTSTSDSQPSFSMTSGMFQNGCP